MSIDPKELRRTLGAFTTGVTVVTTAGADGQRYGVTANSFSSVSLDPPLILWSQATSSKSHQAFKESKNFVVNILADDQVDVSNRFAKSGEIDKFNGLPVSEGAGGVPIIEGSAAHLECTTVAAYPGGDHIIFIGRVDKMMRTTRKPLAFGDGRYMVTFAHDLGGALPAEHRSGRLADLEAVRIASAALPEISQRIGARTVGIAVWGNKGATIVRWEPSLNPVSPHLQTGVVVSLAQSATGLAFSAFRLGNEIMQAATEELRALAAEGKDLTAAFKARVSEARRHGIARVVGDAPSQRHQVTVNAFSVPVFDGQGNMVLAISTTCRSDLMSPDWDGEVPKALLESAHNLSARLGYHASVARKVAEH